MMVEGTRLRVGVTFRKQVSDGNYGTEAAEVQLEAYFDDAEDDEEALIRSLLMAARRYVSTELLRSPALKVRNAVQPPKPLREDVAELPEFEEATY